MILLSLYDINSEPKIILDIGNPAVLQYADEANGPGKKEWPRFRLNIADGE